MQTLEILLESLLKEQMKKEDIPKKEGVGLMSSTLAALSQF